MIELATKPAGIIRIVFKEIVSGDRKKFEAASNVDPTAGGGARDLRFRPHEKFGPVIERMFISTDNKGVSKGRFYWIENDQESSGDAYYYPPTNARPNEGRLANVDRYLPTGNLPPEEEGKILLLLIQDDDKKIWPRFITARSLEVDDWHPKVKELLTSCLHAKRRAGVSTVGFVDFETMESFCNGK